MLMQRSATKTKGESSHLRFITSRFVCRWIIYQSTCEPKIKVKYWNMDEYLVGEMLGWEYVHKKQSAIVINGEGPRLRFNTSHFNHRWILYQSTCGPKIKVKCRNMDENRWALRWWAAADKAGIARQRHFFQRYCVSIRDYTLILLFL